MLNGNKLPRYRTTACRELYSERMRAVEYFSRTNDIDLYGVGWDGPTFRVGKACVPGTFGKVAMPGPGQKIVLRSRRLWQRAFPDPLLVAARSVYRGFARSKAEALSKYKFSLCFENSILKGWTTEKIFDCFFPGTVPVYWGAPDVQDYIPTDCYIDMPVQRLRRVAELSEIAWSARHSALQGSGAGFSALAAIPALHEAGLRGDVRADDRAGRGREAG